MMTTDELKEVIASSVTYKGEVDVVRISHPAITTIYLSPALATGTTLLDENGAMYSVTQSNMSLTDESSGALVVNERQLSLQGINDLIASEEDKIFEYKDTVEDNVPPNEQAKVRVDVLSYVATNDGSVSTIAQGPYRYFNQKSSYSQKSNTVTLNISTSPTNNSETGELATVTKFPTLSGFGA